MIRVQYFSDLHLERRQHVEHKFRSFNIEPCAPYLVIAGDLGAISGNHHKIYKSFLEFLSPLFKYIFIISGNHEYYSNHLYRDYSIPLDVWFDTIETQIRLTIKDLHNVVYLQNETFLIPETNYAVFGTTLWSHIKETEKPLIVQGVRDYECIPNFTPDDSIRLCNHSCMCLERDLKKYQNHRFIVVSHHLPTYQLIASQYNDCGYNSAFATEIELSNNQQIIAWIAGHIHQPIEQGKFHVNPIGYPEEHLKATFNRVIDIT
jgi:predicted MPP superfamily phosphohydrolase